MPRFVTSVAIAAAMIAAAVLQAHPVAVQAATVPAYDHVFVIVMENHSYSELIGSPSAPYINSLAAAGGLATEYHAVAHPSLPNYLALAGGSTFGITSDCTTCWVSAANIGDRLEAAGRTWKAYMESMPSPCFTGSSYPYAQKHNPFVYFDDIRNNTTRCQGHDVPYTQLAADLRSASTTPSFGFITPNLCNDMHDCSVAQGDSWLRAQVPSILSSPAFTTQRSLLAITWDEDDGSEGNRVPLILAGSYMPAAAESSLAYNHYSLLRTIELALGAAPVSSSDTSAVPMYDFFSPAAFGWSALKGILTGDPSAASAGTGRVDVFVRGSDRGLWDLTWNGTAWLAWSPLGGVLGSSPGAVSGSTGRIDVFVRGSDGALWHRWWDGTAWQPWESLGGIVMGGPEAASSSATRVDVFVRGSDSALWHRYWDGAGWHGWESVGGVITSDPGSVSSGAGSLDVFARGVDGALWQRSWNGSAWSAWQSLGGVLDSSPDVTSCAAGQVEVFALGSDHGIWRRTFTAGAWNAWSEVGGDWDAGPSAACAAGGAQVSLFERGPGGALWTYSVGA